MEATARNQSRGAVAVLRWGQDREQLRDLNLKWDLCKKPRSQPARGTATLGRPPSRARAEDRRDGKPSSGKGSNSRLQGQHLGRGDARGVCLLKPWAAWAAPLLGEPPANLEVLRPPQRKGKWVSKEKGGCSPQPSQMRQGKTTGREPTRAASWHRARDPLLVTGPYCPCPADHGSWMHQ